MKLLEKLALTAALTLSSFSNLYSQEKTIPQLPVIQVTESVEMSDINLLRDKIIEYHEKRTNVKYESNKPEIAFDKTADFNDVARYDSDEEKIYLHPRYKKWI
jgi:hypothetical protein